MTIKVLLYSAGLDSWCAAHVWQPDVLLHVDMDTGYSGPEAALLDRAPIPVTRTSLPLAQWEDPDTAIIPLRNLMLACVAAQYGDTVALAATAGDRVLDKTPEFAAKASDLLTWLWQPQWWTPGRQIEVALPVKHLSKTALVAAALAAGASPDDAQTATFSCYSPSPLGRECGACKPCARKWVALRANGITPRLDASGYVRAFYLPSIKDGTWDRGDDEARDVLTALGEEAA